MSKRQRRVVVKVGSGLLTAASGGIDGEQISSLVRQIEQLSALGWKVILVSSGAISAGMTALGLRRRPTELAALQACATIGQPLLMRAYSEAMALTGMVAAQILVTHWDMDSRVSYRNTRATVDYLLSLDRVVPIFNENDALSFEEIEMLNRFGDNDRLSGEVAILVEADLLVILTSIDGLMTRPDGQGRLVRTVRRIDERIRSYAGGTTSERSVGGMISKLETARRMLEEGIPMVIANGRSPDVLSKAVQGKPCGTRFESAKGKPRS